MAKAKAAPKTKAAPKAKKIEVDIALAILSGAMPVSSSDDQERYLLSKGQIDAIREALGAGD